MSFVSNGIIKGCQWGYYVVLLPVGIRHFISLRLPSVKLAKVIPVSRVVRVCKCVSTLPTVPGTENVLNTCSYFFSYYNGGEIIEGWGEVTTKCELKQSIWNPFGNVWFHLYTVWFSCALASMRETDCSWSWGDLDGWDIWRGVGLGWIDDVGMQWGLRWESLDPAVPESQGLFQGTIWHVAWTQCGLIWVLIVTLMAAHFS